MRPAILLALSGSVGFFAELTTCGSSQCDQGQRGFTA